MPADSTLPFTIVGDLDAALLLLGAVSLSGARASADARFVTCHCPRPHCSGVRQVAAGATA